MKRVAHSHQPRARILTLPVRPRIVGKNRGQCSDRLKRIGAVLTACALLLPLGVALRGITEAAKFAEGIARIGGLAFLAACVAMAFLVRATGSQKPKSS